MMLVNAWEGCGWQRSEHRGGVSQYVMVAPMTNFGRGGNFASNFIPDRIPMDHGVFW